MTDPAFIAYMDQFAAHLRDLCRQMIRVSMATEWENFSVRIVDPRPEEADVWEVTFADGDFWLVNFTEDPEEGMLIDLKRLGV